LLLRHEIARYCKFMLSCGLDGGNGNSDELIGFGEKFLDLFSVENSLLY